MHVGRRIVVGSVMAAVGIAACSDNERSVTNPMSKTVQVRAGAFRTTVWAVSSAGLNYIETRNGRYKSVTSGKLIVDPGEVVTVSDASIASSKERLNAEIGVEVLNEAIRPAFISGSISGRQTVRRRFLNSRIIELGSYKGKRISIEMPVTSLAKLPSAAIVAVDGKTAWMQATRWKKLLNGKNGLAHQRRTAYDSTGSAMLIYETDYDEAAVSTVSAADAKKPRLHGLADKLIQIIQPDALHAMPMDEDESIPCYTELQESLARTGIAATADVALGAAIAACGTGIVGDPLAPAACGFIAPLTVAAQAASAAAGLAIANVADCWIKYFKKRDSIRVADSIRNNPPPGGGGNGGGGGGDQGPQCETVVVERSDDDGVTWRFVGYAEVCN